MNLTQSLLLLAWETPKNATKLESLSKTKIRQFTGFELDEPRYSKGKLQMLLCLNAVIRQKGVKTHRGGQRNTAEQIFKTRRSENTHRFSLLVPGDTAGCLYKAPSHPCLLPRCCSKNKFWKRTLETQKCCMLACVSEKENFQEEKCM